LEKNGLCPALGPGTIGRILVLTATTKSVEARYEHREFFATGADLDHDGVEQNRQGGRGCFSSPTVQIC
jgi:hypothetical protein